MASKALSKGQQNFMWISIACVDFIKLPLKNILSNQIKPADLYQRIKSSSTNRKDYLRKEQLNICFIPPPGQPDYNDFDVTLLYTLIRNLCSASLNPTSLNPTRGWGKDPDSSHTRIGDDIERLRLMRNKFAHANSAGIPDAEFQALWNDLKSVIQRIQTLMNSIGSNVNYEQKLADIERTDFGFGDLQKYKLFLEATLNQLKEERIKDEPEILIKGSDRVVWGEKTCFEADLKQKEASHWSISWQRVRGSVTNQIDISKEKYTDSTRTKLVIHSVCKDDVGEYQAVLARESNGNKRKIESNAVFLHVVGELPVFEAWEFTAGMESVTIHYKIKNSAPTVHDITWKKNEEGLDLKTQKYVGGRLLDSYLRITSPNEADKGTYSCTLTNAVGFTSKDVTFDIPIVTISTEPKVYYGLKTQISSNVSSTLPPIKYEWQQSDDGIAFRYINIGKLKYDGTNVSLKNPSLVIQKTTFDDMLYYRLLAWNRIGDCVSNTVYLNVTENIPIATISTESKVYYGFKTQISSKVSSTLPPIKYEWQKSDDGIAFRYINISTLKYYGTNVSLKNPSLVIQKTTFDDMLYYRLLVWTKIGDCVSNTVYLNVTGNPPNITCSHKTCFESRSVELIAKIYLYDTCHAIQEVFWTVNDEKIDKHGLGGKFSKVSVNFPCLTIHNVNRCDAGSYKLSATNALGMTVSDAIELNIPDVISAKIDEKEDGTHRFTVTIKSIPEPSLVQWTKKEKNSDMCQPININSNEFKGSSCSFPHPVLIIKQKEQLENFIFQIEITNFIGTCTQTIQDLSNLVPGTMQSENVSSDEINDGSLNETYNDEVAGIKFAILFDDLADHFPEENFEKLKDLIQSSKKVKNIKSISEAKSVRECFRILNLEKVFTELDVTFMQFLLRRTECKELENKCVEYAEGQRALGFYEKQPEDGFKHVYFHVLGDLSNFNKEKRRLIKETVAAMVECKTDRVILNGYGRSGSFFAIVSIEVIYVGKLVALKEQDRYRFVRLDIDYFIVDFIKVISKLSQKSQRVDHSDHVQKTEQFTPLPPKQSKFLSSRVRDDMSLEVIHAMACKEKNVTYLESHNVDHGEVLQRTFVPSSIVSDTTTLELMHRMTDVEPLNPLHRLRSRESQRVDHSENSQKTEQFTPLPPKQSKFLSSRVRDDMSLEVIHAMACKEKNVTYLESHNVDHGEVLQRTFVPSSIVSDTTTLELMHRMTDEEPLNPLHRLRSRVRSSLKQFKYNAHLMSSITVSTFEIEHISCIKPYRMWLSTENRIMEIDEDGQLLRELSVNKTHTGYHTLSKAGDLLFKKDSDIYMLSSSGEIRNLHIHVNELSCIHLSRLNGDIFVSEEKLITKFNDKGRKLQTITSNPKRICNIVENINGDIIVTNVNNRVVAFKRNGLHQFTYSGLHNGSKCAKGLCADRFGHILVDDSGDRCVHLLHITGHLLAKLLTHQHDIRLEVNAMCVDDKNNLYVGSRNTINVYTYLSDTTITEHEATGIDSEIPSDYE